MADVITRLKIDNSDYEQKLARSVDALRQLERQARESGKSLNDMTDEQRAYVRSLGDFETKSQTVRGRLSELRKAYEELAAQYNRLTAEEKKGDFGKLMSKNLETLRGRIQSSSEELRRINSQIGESSNAWSKMSGTLGDSVAKYASLAAAIGVANRALAVARDVFGANEVALDTWGQLVEECRTTYEAFLTSINTGDISGFLDNISKIQQAARNAYDELDRLGTQKAINNSAYVGQVAANERYRAMLRTGRYIASGDGTGDIAGLKDGDILTSSQREQIAASLKDGIDKANNIIRDEIEQTTAAINALYDKQAATLGISRDEFLAATKDMSTFDTYYKGYEQYVNWQKENTKYVTMQGAGGPYHVAVNDERNPYEQYKWVGVFRDGGEQFTQLNELLSRRSQLMVSSYNSQAQAYRAINRAEGVSVTAGVGKGKAAKADTSWQSALGESAPSYVMSKAANGEDYVIPLQVRPYIPDGAMDNITAEVVKAPLVAMEEELDKLRESLRNAATPEEYQHLNGEFKMLEENIKKFKGEDKLEAMAKAAKKADEEIQALKETWTSVSNAIGSVGDMLQAIENPAAKVAGLVAEAVATVAMTFAQALGKAKGPWDWIAAAAAGTATMISTVSAIKEVTKSNSAGSFSGGGIVPGTPNGGGDSTYIFASPGELVLNRAQTQSIAQQLEAGQASSVGSVSSIISAEQISVIVNNRLRRIGKEAIL